MCVSPTHLSLWLEKEEAIYNSLLSDLNTLCQTDKGEFFVLWNRWSRVLERPKPLPPFWGLKISFLFSKWELDTKKRERRYHTNHWSSHMKSNINQCNEVAWWVEDPNMWISVNDLQYLFTFVYIYTWIIKTKFSKCKIMHYTNIKSSVCLLKCRTELNLTQWVLIREQIMKYLSSKKSKSSVNHMQLLSIKVENTEDTKDGSRLSANTEGVITNWNNQPGSA